MVALMLRSECTKLMQFSSFEILNILIFELAGWKVSYLERYGVSKTPFIVESWGELLKFRKHLLWDFSIWGTAAWDFNTPQNPENTNMRKGIFVYPKVWCYPTFQLGLKLCQRVMSVMIYPSWRFRHKQPHVHWSPIGILLYTFC